MKTLFCPDCGKPMILRSSSKFFLLNGDPHLFFGCTGWPKCKTTHSAHPDGSPVGIPANKKTRDARIAAHAEFDALWKGLHATMTRRGAYSHMRQIMGMAVKQAHIGRFNLSQCEELITKLQASRPCGNAHHLGNLLSIWPGQGGSPQ